MEQPDTETDVGKIDGDGRLRASTKQSIDFVGHFIILDSKKIVSIFSCRSE
jgi:hypothetical protein